MPEESGKPDNARRSAIYLVSEKKGKKALLIFDSGYDLGNVHIYELEESIPFQEVRTELKSLLGLSDSVNPGQTMIIPSWVEHKYGYPSMTYEIKH